MARDDWTAVVTTSAMEYIAHTELMRFGLRSYLPQLRRRWTMPRGSTVLPRRYPLFPGYVLLPIRDAGSPALRATRGLRRSSPMPRAASGAALTASLRPCGRPRLRAATMRPSRPG
jgi:hypothetical protein